MLTGRRAGRVLAVAATVAATLALSPAVHADDGVYCPPIMGDCTVGGSTPGQPGTGDGHGQNTGGSGASTCTFRGKQYPCSEPGLGDFDPTMGCYYERMDPQPAPPSGKDPSKGAWYLVNCGTTVGDPTRAGRPTQQWIDGPAPGNLPTPAELAAEAVKKLPIRGPNIGIAPKTGGSGLVGLPVWMWTTVSDVTWGPSSATAAVPGLSVTATARADHIVWDMGDGNSVTCTKPGTAYRTTYGDQDSPDCGYRYNTPSRNQPDGRYHITATTTWNVTWTGGGQTGQLTVTRASNTSVRIDELQVVTG